MEQLFVRSLIILLLGSAVYAQDSLCVFDLKGSAYLKMQASIQPIGKGSFVNSKSIIMLEQTDVTAIDASGQAYQVKGSGEYPYKEILKNKVLEKGGSLTAKYFRLIWEEFMNKEQDKTIIGGVFRGEIPMVYPPDSAMVVNRSMTFEWDPLWDSETSYFFLRNKATDDLLKLATNGNELTLYKDNPIFNNGTEFEWMVSGDAFPNLNNTPFLSFDLIEREDYNRQLKAFDSFIQDLKVLGISDETIEDTICEQFKLCKN